MEALSNCSTSVNKNFLLFLAVKKLKIGLDLTKIEAKMRPVLTFCTTLYSGAQQIFCKGGALFCFFVEDSGISEVSAASQR